MKTDDNSTENQRPTSDLRDGDDSEPDFVLVTPERREGNKRKARSGGLELRPRGCMIRTDVDNHMMIPPPVPESERDNMIFELYCILSGTFHAELSIDLDLVPHNRARRSSDDWRWDHRLVRTDH